MVATRSLDPGDLRKVRLLRDVEPSIVARLAEVGRARELAEGEHVFRAGEVAAHLFEIVRGLVHVERALPSGQTSTIGIFGPHEHVGVPAVLERGTYPADAIAASTTLLVVHFPAEAIFHATSASPALANAVQRALLEHTHALRAKIDVLSAGSVSARLGVLLTHLAERFGDEGPGGSIMVPIALSRASLARLVSARVETVIRAMSRLQREGLVTTTKDGFEIPSAGALAKTINAS
jgi:CRP-like cAMP-binding protein